MSYVVISLNAVKHPGRQVLFDPVVDGLLKSIAASSGDRAHCPSAILRSPEAVAGLGRVPRPASGLRNPLPVCTQGKNEHGDA